MAKPESTVERVGAYRVVRRIATGGTSDVLLAKAEGPHGFERNVVLKILLSEFGGDDEIKGMFVREAAAYARLAHPAIVRLFDFFAVPTQPSQPGQPRSVGKEGQLVMVLEYVDGPALSRLRSMLKAVGRELADEAAIYLSTRIFSALAAAHAATNESGALAPVIHRDVNPSNVLVPWDGEVKLADFGVAKVSGVSHQSVAGLIRGTYGYMAPEQVAGGIVTPRADVYAAAIILWELLTKRRAFQRGALPESEALRAMAEPHLASIDAVRPEVDRAVRDALKRALEPRPDRRTVTAEEMVSILSSVVPPDLGRERLVAALASMRDDARARAIAEAAPRPSTIPPPDPEGTTPFAPAVLAGRSAELSRGTAKLPPARLPSRPNLPVPTPAPGARASSPALPGSPRPPEAAGPPPVPKAASRTGMLAARATGRGEAPPLPAKSASSTTLLIGSVGRAADERQPRTDKTSESLIETPRVPAVVDAPPKAGAVSPKGPGHAMDEILRAVPSSMPPLLLDGARGGAVDTPRMGHIPAAPAPLESALRQPQARPVDALAATLPPGAVVDPLSPTTPRMMPLARTMLLGPLVDPPLSEGEGLRFSPLAAPLPGRAGPTPTPTPAPPVSSPAYAPPPQMPYGPMPTAPSDPPRSPPPQMPYGPMPTAPIASSPAPASAPSAGFGSKVGAVVAILVGFVLLGIGGAVGFTRYQSSRSDAHHHATPTGVPPRESSPALARSGAPPAAGGLALTGSAPAASAPATASTPSARPSAAEPEPEPTPPPASATASAAPPPTASAPGASEGTGTLSTAGTPAGHRIFVDERVVGQTPQSVSVPCGKHIVRLGSAGKPQPVDVPCNGEVAVGEKGP